MLSYLFNRIGYGLIVLVLVATIVSSIVYLSPVDPARLTFGQRLDEASVTLKRQQLGLDQPLSSQVFTYLKNISPVYICNSNNWPREYGDAKIDLIGLAFGVKAPSFGESYQSGRPVMEIISQAFPNTFYLAITAMLIALFLGILLGIIAAIYQGTWLDHLIIGFSTLGYSVPSYVTAMIFGILFGYYWRNVTGLNIQGSLFELNDFGDPIIVYKNIVLPAIALGIRPIAIITQLMRSTILQVKKERFVNAAIAKGLNPFQVMKRHILTNALNPVITAASGWFASLLAGAFFVEFVFNFKGLGFITINALLNYDIPVVLGALLITSFIFVLINIAVDLFYTVLDPRISINS